IVFESLPEITPRCRQVLIALDLCLLGIPELELVYSAIETRASVLRHQTAIVCSHTHAAGFLALDRESLPGGEFIPDYLQRMSEKVAQLVADALNSMQDATISYGTGWCDLAAHRDQWDEQRQHYVCGHSPLTEADRTLLLGVVHDNHDRRIGAIVNYACHPTTLAWDNTQISPDFPGAMRDMVEEKMGCPCVFLQGASGDLGPRQGFLGDTSVADRNGRQLGYAALTIEEGMLRGGTRFVYQGVVESGAAIGNWAVEHIDRTSSDPSQVVSTWRGKIGLKYREELPTVAEVELELARLTREEVEANDRGDLQNGLIKRAMVERQRRELTRRRSHPPGSEFPWEVALWRIGGAIWVCAQGEPYSYLQSELRRRFPQHPILVASLGFDWGLGYLPIHDCYGKNLYQQNIAIVERGSLEFATDRIAAEIALLLEG
ncbi:MAG: hypothetical protein O2931_07905, partial [Planctomycetota bacterium]|nr:hypothetical protein [Planctomycetota bacterium]